MKIEERADGLHISGYVNVTGKISRPLSSPIGQFVETIEERAFSNALSKSGNVQMTVDHNPDNICADTENGTLSLNEDAIGLRAEAVTTNESVIDAARHGKIKGWSFGMRQISDEMEQRSEGQLPLRHIKDFILDHVTLVIQKTPCYAATSVECRADEEVSVECRSFDTGIEIEMQKKEAKVDYTDYISRIAKLEKR